MTDGTQSVDEEIFREEEEETFAGHVHVEAAKPLDSEHTSTLASIILKDRVMFMFVNC